MANEEKVIVTKSKLDSLAVSIANKSGATLPLTIAQMKSAVDDISTGGGSGTPNLQSKTNISPTESSQTITADSGYDGLSSVQINAISSSYIGSGIDQNDSTDLTVSGDTVTVPSGYYATSASKAVASGTAGTPVATKGAVSSNSISVIPSVTNTTGYITGNTKTGTAVTVSASELVSGTYTVDDSGTANVTNYAFISVPAGTEGTPSATKGTVSNHSISVTPSVTNTSGWIAGGTQIGTIVTVSASELASGNKSISSNGTDIDVVGYSTVSVSVSPNLQSKTGISPTTSSQTISADNEYDGLSSVQIDAMPNGTTGTPSATKGTVSNHSVSITPSVTNTTGYITGGTKTGTAVTVTASELVSGNKEITSNGTNIDVVGYSTVSVAVPPNEPNLQAKTNIVPSTSSQTITPDNGYDGLSSVQINAMPSGSATTPATTITANPSISVNASGLITATASASQSVTPTVSAGYVSTGTSGTVTVSGSNTQQLTTLGATTYNTSTTDQTITSGKYITGTQTIKGVTVSGLSAENIVSGVTVKVGDANDDDRITSVTGSLVIQTYYTGSSDPSSSLGTDGDIYLKVVS